MKDIVSAVSTTTAVGLTVAAGALVSPLLMGLAAASGGVALYSTLKGRLLKDTEDF